MNPQSNGPVKGQYVTVPEFSFFSLMTIIFAGSTCKKCDVNHHRIGWLLFLQKVKIPSPIGAFGKIVYVGESLVLELWRGRSHLFIAMTFLYTLTRNDNTSEGAIYQWKNMFILWDRNSWNHINVSKQSCLLNINIHLRECSKYLYQELLLE